ncbi:MAG: NAD-dependent epimerase/dehydratase family protein [Roseiflexaceae bacterium]|nr:NAD-dependent epimerase/dehydratase family protein [Roseiflexaceae bacterium]
MSTHDVHVVFGAGGGAGHAIIRELATRGLRVRAVSRSGSGSFPAGVEVLRADASDAASALRASQGATSIYHAVGAPYHAWAQAFPPIMDALIGAASATGARLVYVDNHYAYGPHEGALTEDLPSRAPGAKGQLRARLAERLMQAHASGQVRATIGRGAEFYGPGVDVAYTGSAWFRSILEGKRAMWVGGLDQPHALSYIDDFAHGIVTLGTRTEALGQIWHIPTGEAMTGRQFLALAYDVAGQPAQYGSLPTAAVRLVGLWDKQAREFAEVVYTYQRPFLVSGAKFTRTFGFTPTPAREALRATFAALQGAPVLETAQT